MALGLIDGGCYFEGEMIVNLSEAARLLKLSNWTIAKRLELGNIETALVDKERIFPMKDILRPGERVRQLRACDRYEIGEAV
jgi:hypothetical protein